MTIDRPFAAPLRAGLANNPIGSRFEERICLDVRVYVARIDYAVGFRDS
jgi:hypothetical protein